MASTSRNNKRTPQTTIIKVGANEAGKLPPQALELEDSVLGALMIEKDAYGSVADLLRPEVFYKDQNRLVFEAIRALAAKDEPIDILSVGEKLKNQGTLEKAGGVVYLAELTRRIASTAHLRYHAQIIAQKATARDLIAMANHATESETRRDANRPGHRRSVQTYGESRKEHRFDQRYSVRLQCAG